jgi:hypothetical protein
MNKAIKEKRILGIHAAIIGLTNPDIANVALIVIKRMYPMLRASPMPIFIPIPPFTLRDEREAPIRVSINADIIEANLV